MNITIEEGMMESALPLFGFRVSDDGIVFDSDNMACRDDMGLIHADEVGIIAKGVDGELFLVRDNYPMIIDYVKWKNNLDKL